MSATTNIRPLRREDREQLHSLLLETGFFIADEVAIAMELIDVVLDKPGQEDYIINVYEEHGEVLGYYCIGPTPATQATFDMYWIAVKPDAQGKGVGKALDAHAEQILRSQQGNLVIAETSSQPRYESTRKFYAARGYAELARIRDYYRPGDDLVVYGKYLS